MSSFGRSAPQIDVTLTNVGASTPLLVMVPLPLLASMWWRCRVSGGRDDENSAGAGGGAATAAAAAFVAAFAAAAAAAAAFAGVAAFAAVGALLLLLQLLAWLLHLLHLNLLLHLQHLMPSLGHVDALDRKNGQTPAQALNHRVFGISASDARSVFW